MSFNKILPYLGAVALVLVLYLIVFKPKNQTNNGAGTGTGGAGGPLPLINPPQPSTTDGGAVERYNRRTRYYSSNTVPPYSARSEYRNVR